MTNKLTGALRLTGALGLAAGVGATMLLPWCVPPKPPIADVDAFTVTDTDADELEEGRRPSACKRACLNLRRLGCDAGGPACESACLHAQSSGVVDLHPECIADAARAADLAACGKVTECR